MELFTFTMQNYNYIHEIIHLSAPYIYQEILGSNYKGHLSSLTFTTYLPQ